MSAILSDDKTNLAFFHFTDKFSGSKGLLPFILPCIPFMSAEIFDKSPKATIHLTNSRTIQQAPSSLISPSIPANSGGKFGEQFTEPNQMSRNSTTGNNKGHCGDDHRNPANYTQGQLLPKDQDSEKHGSHRFQGPKNSGRSRSYVLNGSSCAKKGNRCRENSKGQEISPQIPLPRQTESASEIKTDPKQRQPEQQHIKSNFKRRHVFERRPIDSYNIDRIGQSRHQYQRSSYQAERRTVTSLIQHADSPQSQQNAQAGPQLQLFLKQEGHNKRHHNRIYEQQSRGDTRIHIIITLKQRKR